MEENITKNICKIRVSTLNLKGDDSYIEELVHEISENGVEIANIQGVSNKAKEVLFRNFKKEGYTFIRFDLRSDDAGKRPFSEFIFSKSPILEKKFVLFVAQQTSLRMSCGMSENSRGISKYLVVAGSRTQNPQNVWIYTSQLEVGGSGNGIRKVQIEEIAAEASKEKYPVIFAGDNCIPSWQHLTCPSSSGWYDAWREKGTSDTEKTSAEDRMDRIWYFSSEGKIFCINFFLICNRECVVADFLFTENP